MEESCVTAELRMRSPCKSEALFPFRVLEHEICVRTVHALLHLHVGDDVLPGRSLRCLSVLRQIHDLATRFLVFLGFQLMLCR